MAITGIDLGNPPINVSEDNYKIFFNQQAKQETTKNRVVFKTDYQRFIWAFVLGIRNGERLPLVGKKASSFKWQVIPQDSRTMILGLTIQELYKDNPTAIKEDIEKSEGNSFNDSIRHAIEEYANAGFVEIRKKQITNPAYIENFDDVIEDILN